MAAKKSAKKSAMTKKEKPKLEAILIAKTLKKPAKKKK